MAEQTSLVAQQVRLMHWAEQIRECQNRPEGMDGLERIGGEPRGLYGAVDGTAAEREPLGKLSGGEVYRIYRWGKAFDGDGYGLHAENTGPYQGF